MTGRGVGVAPRAPVHRRGVHLRRLHSGPADAEPAPAGVQRGVPRGPRHGPSDQSDPRAAGRGAGRTGRGEQDAAPRPTPRRPTSSGVPALAIPSGFNSKGLPVGMQFWGKAFAESTLLRVGYAYQQHARWFERRPPRIARRRQSRIRTHGGRTGPGTIANLMPDGRSRLGSGGRGTPGRRVDEAVQEGDRLFARGLTLRRRGRTGVLRRWLRSSCSGRRASEVSGSRRLPRLGDGLRPLPPCLRRRAGPRRGRSGLRVFL